MSRSNPTLTNPAEHFFEWAGGKGLLQWYDKENQKNVQVKIPFEFLVLDQLTTITGYSKQLESGYWANEVRDQKKDELFVRTKKGPFEAGLYEHLTETRSKGGKYAKSIYLAHKIGDEWHLGNFKASGSALSAWIEFTNSVARGALDTGKVIMTQGAAQEAPTGQFYPPQFELVKATDEENNEAIRLDRELQIYLNQYLATPRDEEGMEVHDGGTVEDGDGFATPEQKADFESRRTAAAAKPQPSSPPAQVDDIVITDIDENEPINLDDIPF